jgi:predicted DNA-binding transcriptional regulator AlpA
MTKFDSINLLTTKQTADLLGLKFNSLEIWRLQGKGPKYRKIGRLVRYAESDILEYLDSQTRTSTSQNINKRKSPQLEVAINSG